MNFENTWAIVDLDAIAANMAAVCGKVGVPVMAVIKANAYGHGAIPVARYLEKYCAFFGVSSIIEGLELRRSGIQTPILILGHTPDDALLLAAQEDIRPAIFTLESAQALSQAGIRLGKTVPFHFALDTGMSRLGFSFSEESADLCAQAAALPNIRAEGLFSHYATADCADLSRAKAQAQRFDTFVEMLRCRGVEIPICHMSNSAGVMNFSKHYDLVRAGIVIYGLSPSGEIDPERLSLIPALSWHSRISHIALLPPGREIGYGGTYVTTAPTRVATIPAGYADGYPRSLSNRFHVLIHGKKAPILGKVCMDQMMVDVTHIPEAAVGSRVVLLGQDGQEKITAQELSESAGSFHYELLCGIARRVPRHYISGGSEVQTVRYLLDP